MAAPGYIEAVPDPAGDPRRVSRFTRKVADLLNALVRSGQLSRTAAEAWQVAAATVADGSVTTAKLAALAVTTAKIADDAVTYAKLQNVSATSRFLGRVTAGAGNAEELTGTQATTLLDAFTASLKGLVPASGGSTGTKYLDDTGAFTTPAGGGGSSTFTPPSMGSFAWVNQGAATSAAPATTGGIFLSKPTQGSANAVTQIVRAIPGSTWTAIWGYRPACGWTSGNFATIGPTAYDSATGKILQVRLGGLDDFLLRVQKFTNATTNLSVPFGPVNLPNYGADGGGYMVRLVNDGTDLRASYGAAQDVWVEFWTEAVGTFITPDKVGFSVNAFSDLGGAHLFHHSLTSP